MTGGLGREFGSFRAQAAGPAQAPYWNQAHPALSFSRISFAREAIASCRRSVRPGGRSASI